MKISLKWTQDYVDVSDYMNKASEIGDMLTRAGLEVEEVIDRRKDYDQVVVGLLLERDKHPNADRLTVCKVTTGEGVVHQIVCGATNHKAGDRVVVALPGAVLPGNFAIKRSAIRNVESGGMLCSTKELGLAGDSDGILILPENAPIGKPFAEYKGLDDVVFELKVTPNRADCLSHYGLAREIACLLGRELKAPRPTFTETSASTRAEISLDVKATDLCPRYCGRFIRGVKVGPSPDWLKQRLESVGLNSVNNVVDATNCVMMELGQPLHAFDAAQLKGRKIIVDRAVNGEKFTALDGREFVLKGEELVIRDGERVVALAGVVGGKNSGVSESSTDIFLESAYFLPMTVRKASRGHGIETDSAYRFSRGVDPDGARRAMDRATELILQIAGGEALGDVHDVYPNPPKKAGIEFRLEQITERVGTPADESKFLDFMKRLGCGVEPRSPGAYQILPPSFRFDLEQDVDLIEEYARLHGYDKIPETMPTFATAPSPHDEKTRLHRRVHRSLRGGGFFQAWNLGFTSKKGETAFFGGLRGLNAAGLQTFEKSIPLRNPLSDELDTMRSGLSYGLFRNMVSNVRDGNIEGALYEIGESFHLVDGAYKENTRLGLVQWGRSRALWTKNLQQPVVFDLKAAIEKVLESFHQAAFTWSMPSDKGEVPGFCHRGQYAQLTVEGRRVGFVATVHPSLLEEQKVRVPVAIAELDLESLLKGQPRPWRSESYSKFPAIERDLALVMPTTVKVGEVLKEIRKTAGALLVETEVFDVYEGDKVEAGHKSVAFRLTYQDKNATLQDAQVLEVQNKVLEALKRQFSAVVR